MDGTWRFGKPLSVIHDKIKESVTYLMIILNFGCGIIGYFRTRKWFDSYDDQETVIMDDFYGYIPWSVLLNITDKFSCKVDASPSQWYEGFDKND
ncbi:13249_t:CDS:2 [Ambispora gerdemannii]|uniref:13249_t:CDS:1 n=1 Tax=Ambispora gerdemannii TaxID=144530 RepID=A0A9N9BRQ7_9GLOM|nr:13249_t:CDS:2 [Ambispora gerdemannii]